MQELHERLRKFHEQMQARCERGWEYWKQSPPYQTGDKLVEKTSEVVEALARGGDVRSRCLELAFIAFAVAEKAPEISNALERIQNANVGERMITEDDVAEQKDRENWRG